MKKSLLAVVTVLTLACASAQDLTQAKIQKEQKDSYEHLYNYGNTLFGLCYGVYKKPVNYADMVSKLEAAFSECTQLDPNRPEAYLALGKSHFNQAISFNDSLKTIMGKTPVDEANKRALQTQTYNQIIAAISPLETVFSYYDGKSEITTFEKAYYKVAISLLADCYRYINNKEKAKFFSDKYAAVDSK
jgi:hypothetical protein